MVQTKTRLWARAWAQRLTAGALAATLTLTSVAPVQAADKGEIGRFLLGAGALFVIGSALANANPKVTRAPHTPHVVTPPKVHPPVTHRPPRNVVPVACLRHNQYAEGPRRYFGRRCLNKRMPQANRLPQGCLRSVWTQRGHRNVYAARCLRRSGWVFG